jgi:hypothetical protein
MMTYVQNRPRARRPRASDLALRGAFALPAGALALLLVLTGCGGGGGGSGGSRTAAPAGSTPAAVPAANPTGPAVVNPTPGGAGGQVAFEQTTYPLLTQYCAACHAGAGPGFPNISHPDPGTAYRAVIDNQKVNLNTPANSRLVQRLTSDLHHCWTNNCAQDGADMEAAITQWAAIVFAANPPPVPTPGGVPGPNTIPGVIASDVRLLANAQKAASGRFEGNVIAQWKFEEGQGTTAFDTSNVNPRMDLTLNNVTWLSGSGIEMTASDARATTADSLKLYNLVASGSGTQQYTIEAWIVPANTTQDGPARIVSYSSSTGSRNFMMGQQLYSYVFRNRAVGTDGNGNPALVTADADEDLQATLQHAVMTYDQVNGRRVWVNGVDTGDRDPMLPPGLLVTWDQTHRLVLGNEVSNNRPWAGQIKLVTIYNRALTPTQIAVNYLAGASQKFVLRFGLDQWVDPGTMLDFEVSEFDAYSYLFCFPTINSPNPSGYPVEAMRVAVNGITPAQSQSFVNVIGAVDNPVQPLSPLCSVVPKDLGPALDQFAIVFDVLGANVNRTVEPMPTIPVDNSVLPPLPGTGIRSFDQVNATMAELTGIAQTSANVQATFGELTEGLPPTTDLRSFVSSHQVAILKLALEYCDSMVESVATRQSFFGPTFDFNQPVVVAFSDQTRRDMILDPLIDGMLGVGIANQPTRAEVHPLLDQLLTDLTAGCNATNCDATRTRSVVKGLCAAVLSSSATQLH